MNLFKNPEDQKPIEELIKECELEAEEALKDPYVFEKPIQNVAVIGAGPSGLPVIRHLKEAGMNVRGFERNAFVGGLWIYSERTPIKPKIPTSRIKREVESAAVNAPSEGREKKLLEMTPETMNLLLRKCPPSPCYRDLYTNTATSNFAYPDFPFPEGTPELCRRQVVADYFDSYAEKFDLLPLIEFSTSVDLVVKNGDTWELSLSKYDVNPGGMVKVCRWKETFDAVVCATGKHQEAFVPEIKDLLAWNKIYPSKVSHSNQYRRPEDYKNKNVLVVGGSISAVDVARAVDGIAKSVTMSIDGEFETRNILLKEIRSRIPESVTVKSNISSFSNPDGEVDGTITFKDGTTLGDIDHVIFCTGYTVRFDFLGEQVVEQTEEEAQEQNQLPRPSYKDVPKGQVIISKYAPLNLYRELFLMSDPTLAFVGIPPYPTTPTHFDAHGRCVSRVWSGRAKLPNEELMFKSTSEYDSDVSLLNLFNADRRNMVPFVAWMNTHAKAIEGDNELPELPYLGEEYEEVAFAALERWGELSETNLQETKQYIRERYL